MQSAPDDKTVGELRADCEQRMANVMNDEAPLAQQETMTPAEERLYDNEVNYESAYGISAFQPNYFMATYNNNPNESPYVPLTGGGNVFDKGEAKFQISIKAPLWRNLFDSNNDLLVAYTSTSWWQITNSDISSVFRETNYQPEIFLRHTGGPNFLGGKLTAFDVGFNHQSNGRSQVLSRSWNRVLGRAYFDYDSLVLGVRAWYRVPEDDEDDDNPGMYRYYGYGDVTAAYAPNKNTFTAMLRPSTEGTAVELTWSYPVTKAFRIYTQYWNGYGESLIDYNVKTERIGIGIALNDWLERR
jgi:phospholipase A1